MKAPLTWEEKALLGYLWRSWADKGSPPRLKELARTLGLFPVNMDILLESLERKDYIRRDEKTGIIVVAYPFSARPTPHHVVLRGDRHLFAICAINALGSSQILQQDVTIASLCPSCQAQIVLEVRQGKISSVRPETAVVLDTLPMGLYDPRKGCTLAETYCRSTNFFCSREDALSWTAQEGPEGKVLHLDEALVRARFLFSRLA